MSYIQFESAREKEKIRQELRDAREQMLEKAKQSSELRDKRLAQKVLSGETTWMLPSVSAKLDKMSSVSSKSKKKDKKKKLKQSKKSKRKKKRKSSSSESDSDTSEEKSYKTSKNKLKKRRSRKQTESSDSADSSESGGDKRPKHKKRKNRTSSNSDPESSYEGDDWIEKPITAETPVKRDSWMTEELKLKTFSREKPDQKPKEKQIDAYDPAKSTRELNPYWKSSGTGLPSAFQKPRDESDEDVTLGRSKYSGRQTSSSTKNWQKKTNEMPKQNAGALLDAQKSRSTQVDSTTSESSDNEDSLRDSVKQQSAVEHKNSTSASSFLTDQQMNELAAKIIKAEILGNNELVQQLKEKLENARANREHIKDRKQENNQPAAKQKTKEHILLTHTDKKGNCRPLQQSQSINPNDLYGGRSGKKKAKQQRIETHLGGERVRYFADDDKYDIKQMFEREKYTSAADSNLQFANIASKNKNPNDDLEDIFADKIRNSISKEETDKKELSRAIHEEQKLSAKLENCGKCFESDKMDKKLIVSMGEKVYLALPWHIGLQTGHCLLVPTQHVNCCTQLDEDTWEELNDFRKALTKMYAAQKKDVIFFEIANKLHRHPHLAIHCVPIRDKDGEMAPFYFKKAIEESEHEWSVNKQLVSLRSKGLRSSIPKGLPYIWVNFGMDSGFAHVIEDQDRFPANFAQEIIGGLLHLDPSKWRRPQKEQNIIAKVKMFADSWKRYDCTH